MAIQCFLKELSKELLTIFWTLSWLMCANGMDPSWWEVLISSWALASGDIMECISAMELERMSHIMWVYTLKRQWCFEDLIKATRISFLCLLFTSSLCYPRHNSCGWLLLPSPYIVPKTSYNNFAKCKFSVLIGIYGQYKKCIWKKVFFSLKQWDQGKNSLEKRYQNIMKLWKM